MLAVARACLYIVSPSRKPVQVSAWRPKGCHGAARGRQDTDVQAFQLLLASHLLISQPLKKKMAEARIRVEK